MTARDDSTSGFDPGYLVMLDEIYHCGWAARKKRRLALLRAAVDHFWPSGHPTRLVLVTGTDGKGSVAHYLEQGFAAAGTTGSWTGPHVFDYAERFHVEGESPGRGELVEIYRERVEPYQRRLVAAGEPEPLSFAALGILMALHLFERRGVVWAAMEVGSGGRYAPISVLDAAACVLTGIGHDHPRTLGAEPWQRALEKAGIARAGTPFFTAAEGAAREWVTAAAAAEGAPVRVVGETDFERARRAGGGDEPEHVARNRALAAAVVRHFYPEGEPEERLFERMTRRLPARFWRVEPNVVADVAHNPGKTARLAEALRLAFPSARFHLLLGLTRKRDAREVFAPLLELAERVVVTGASYAGRDPAEVAAELAPDFRGVEAVVDPRRAFQQERGRLGEGAVLVLTGSAYMIDQALNPDPYVRHLNATFGWRARGEEGGSSQRQGF